MKSFVAIVLAFASGIGLLAQGYVVPNGVVYVGFNGAGYEIDISQNPTNSNYTGFWLTSQGKTPPTAPYINTFSFDSVVDEGVRVFLVSVNQPMSQQAIRSGSYTELMYPNSYVFNSGVPFYLGLYTGETFPQNGVYSDPLFGWAKLVNNRGAIEMLDSALAYKAGGIYVGTQNLIPVPEPSSVVILLLGGSAWGIRRLRKRQP
jgi:hypothetical protein